MLLTLETEHPRAEDLGYLLHKHPAKLQSFTQSENQRPPAVSHFFYNFLKAF